MTRREHVHSELSQEVMPAVPHFQDTRLWESGADESKRDTSKQASKDEQRIAELAKLSPLKFAQCSKQAATDLGITLGELNKLVKARRAQSQLGGNLMGQTDFHPHWRVEPWATLVDSASLLDGLRWHFARYVVLPKHADVALALWTLHTWVFDCFDITPYLAITSPTRRCGKTLLMSMLYWLCCRAKKNDSMSKAAIYRSVERDKPTLCLDEVSWVVDLRDDRQGILCGGFERLGHAEVCEGEGADITPRMFSTFCPKAFGLIGKLTATLMDRSIEIAMQRKLNEKVERLRRRDNDDHARFRRQCGRWAADNRGKLAAIMVPAPDGLNDRAFDAWEPLLAIAAHAGGDWPKLAADAAIALSGGENVTEERSVEFLRDTKTELDRRGRPAVTTKTLIAGLCADEEKPWTTYNRGQRITDRQVAKLLKPFGIISETVQTSETGEAQAKGYRRAHFGDAFDRYLKPAQTSQNNASGQTDGSQASKRTKADETGITDDFRVRPETNLDGSEMCEKPVSQRPLYAWTDKNPPGGGEASSGSCHSGKGAAPFHPDIEDAHEELWGHSVDDLTIPPFLDRRPQPRQHGKWAGTYVSDDDAAFLESGGFK
jgi:putative DNA primase/helicase